MQVKLWFLLKMTKIFSNSSSKLDDRLKQLPT